MMDSVTGVSHQGQGFGNLYFSQVQKVGRLLKAVGLARKSDTDLCIMGNPVLNGQVGLLGIKIRCV